VALSAPAKVASFVASYVPRESKHKSTDDSDKLPFLNHSSDESVASGKESARSRRQAPATTHAHFAPSIDPLSPIFPSSPVRGSANAHTTGQPPEFSLGIPEPFRFDSDFAPNRSLTVPYEIREQPTPNEMIAEFGMVSEQHAQFLTEQQEAEAERSMEHRYYGENSYGSDPWFPVATTHAATSAAAAADYDDAYGNSAAVEVGDMSTSYQHIELSAPDENGGAATYTTPLASNPSLLPVANATRDASRIDEHITFLPGPDPSPRFVHAYETYKCIIRLVRKTRATPDTTHIREWLATHMYGILENDWEYALEKQIRMYFHLLMYAGQCAAKNKLTYTYNTLPMTVERMTRPHEVEVESTKTWVTSLLYGRTHLVDGLVGVFQRPSEYIQCNQNQEKTTLCNYPAFVFSRKEVQDMPFENNTQVDACKEIQVELKTHYENELVFIGIPFAPGVMFNHYRAPHGYDTPSPNFPPPAALVENAGIVYDPSMTSACKLPSQADINQATKASASLKHNKAQPVDLWVGFYDSAVFMERKIPPPPPPPPSKKKSRGATASIPPGPAIERVVAYGNTEHDFWHGTELLMQACHVCFHEEQAVENQLLKCTHPRCTRYYHQQCISYKNKNRGLVFASMRDRMRWTCPLHLSNVRSDANYWANIVDPIPLSARPNIDPMHPREQNVCNVGWIDAKLHMTLSQTETLARFMNVTSLAHAAEAANQYLFWALSSGSAAGHLGGGGASPAAQLRNSPRTQLGLCLRAKKRIASGTCIDLGTSTEERDATYAAKRVNIGEACSPQQFGMHVFRYLHVSAASLGETDHNAECIAWQPALTCDNGKGIYDTNPSSRLSLSKGGPMYQFFVPCVIRTTKPIAVGESLRIGWNLGTFHTHADSAAASSSSAAAVAAAAAAAATTSSAPSVRMLLVPYYMQTGKIRYNASLETALVRFFASVCHAETTRSLPHRYFCNVIDMADALRSWTFLFDAVFSPNLFAASLAEITERLIQFCETGPLSLSALRTPTGLEDDDQFAQPFHPHRRL
jgi:hypothetical protein